MRRGEVNFKYAVSDYMPAHYELNTFNPQGEVLDMIKECDYYRAAAKAHIVGASEYKVTEKDGEILIKALEELGYTVVLEDNRKQFSYEVDPTWKTEPLSHQVKSLQFSRKHRCFMLSDEMGLGKTMQALNIAQDKKVNCGCKHCLIICCMSSTVLNWEREVHKHTDLSCIVLGRFAPVSGLRAAKLWDIKRIPEEYFWILNIEALRTAEISKLLSQYTRKGVIDMVIIDELHLCKTPTSEQAKGILSLQPEFKLALSGTPVVKNPLTMYVPLKWLEFISETYTDYCNRYVEFANFGARIPRGFRHTWELRRMLEAGMLRRRKAEVLDLPEKVREVIHLVPGDVQKKAYFEAMSLCDMDKFHSDWAREHLNILQGYLLLRQAANDVKLYDNSKESCSIKMDWAMDKVLELVEDGQCVVIFSCFKYMVYAFSERLKAEKIAHACITGDVNAKKRDAAIAGFGQETKCIVGTVQAAGVGLNMVAAHTVIFLDLPWDRATLEQAEDRIHRIGSTSKVTSYLLLTDGTIDEDMYELLEKKGRFADCMLSEG